MKFHESYRKLAAATLPPTDHSDLMLTILSKALTPEEADFLLALPAAPKDLAQRFALTEASVQEKIQSLLARGMAVTRQQGVVFLAEIALLRDEMLTSAPEHIGPEIRQLWKDYYNQTLRQELVDWFVTTDPPMLRIIPAQKSVPEGVELLPWEDIRQVIQAAKTSTVRECCCRSMVEACDLPQDVCVQFNGRADYAVNRGAAKAITVEEVLATAEKAEDAGLVPMVANIASLEPLEYLCYCCGDCCVVIEPLKSVGTEALTKGLAKSRFEAGVDQQSCTGCQKCLKRCQFDAISLEKVEGAKALKAVVDPDKCWGCGACVLTCKPKSITLKVVRPPEYIPSHNPYLIL